MNKIFRQSMEVGYYFKNEVNDDRTDDWYGSEECATFTKIILDYAKENGCDISFAFYEIMDETIEKIHNEDICVEEHMGDDYYKGFVAGEILGFPTKENLRKVGKAEKLWKDANSYGYYQEVLYDILEECR